MKPLEKHELYENLTGFLKTKGIELKAGSYAQAIQKSCSLLTDAINLGQGGLEKAKTKIDTKLDQVRQVIHEKTAPKSANRPTTATNVTADSKASTLKSAPRKPRSRKPRSSST
jgi:hypothetical protein